MYKTNLQLSGGIPPVGRSRSWTSSTYSRGGHWWWSNTPDVDGDMMYYDRGDTYADSYRCVVAP